MFINNHNIFSCLISIILHSKCINSCSGDPCYIGKTMENNKYHTVGTFPKSSRKTVESGQIYTPNTQIHDHPLSWFGTGTSIKSGVVKLVLWTRTSSLREMRRSCTCFQQVGKISALTYKQLDLVLNRTLCDTIPFSTILTLISSLVLHMKLKSSQSQKCDKVKQYHISMK